MTLNTPRLVSIVIGKSTYLDSLRFRAHLAERFAVSPSCVEAYVVGVRYANITIIEGIGASQYGVGMVAARVAEVVLRNERGVFPVGCYNARYGVALSLPSVVGRQGVAEAFLPEMSDGEKRALERSAETLRDAVEKYLHKS
jgi:L-lactate dehydrogenase